MGEIFGVKCSKCDFTFSVNLGHGMAGCAFFEIDEETKKPYFYGEIKYQQVLSDVEHIMDTWDNVEEDENAYAWRSDWFRHGSGQYLCQECGQLHNKFLFALKGSGGKYQPTYYCTTCNNILTFVELKINESGTVTIKSEQPIIWSCPQCENDRLVRDPNGGHILYD